MKPAPFAYVRPSSLSEALTALGEDPDAKVLAGGQSLLPLLSMRLAQPSRLVDINGLPDLDHVDVTDEGVRVGALARHSAVLASAAVERVQPLVTLALRHVAHATIRNRGTTVGSVVHADPASELPAVLALLGGSVDVQGPRGRRTVAAEELYVGPLETSLSHDEIAVEAFFPALGPRSGVAFEELARRHGDYAMAGVAALVEVDGDDVVSASAGFFSVCERPTVVDLTCAEDPGEAALAELEPSADIHASLDYRRQLVRVLTPRVLAAATEHARRRAHG